MEVDVVAPPVLLESTNSDLGTMSQEEGSLPSAPMAEAQPLSMPLCEPISQQRRLCGVHLAR
jgi:hypothetical protein